MAVPVAVSMQYASMGCILLCKELVPTCNFLILCKVVSDHHA